MTNTTYFIDANIVLYSVGKPHPLKAPCLAVMEDLARRTILSATNIEVLQEILHIYSRRGERSFGIEMAQNLSSLVTTVLAVTPEDFARALIFHRQYPDLMARDSLHLASLHNNRITHIVSVDKHFDNLPGITRIDPLDWENR
jgi:uncharacterized protein